MVQIFKPTRKELVNLAINHYAEQLREQSKECYRESAEIEKKIGSLNDEVNAKLLTIAREPHAEHIDRLNTALAPFGYEVSEKIHDFGNCKRYEYRADIELYTNVYDLPDDDPLKTEIRHLQTLNSDKIAEGRKLSERAGKLDEMALYTKAINELPEEEQQQVVDLLDQLTVALAKAVDNFMKK